MQNGLDAHARPPQSIQDVYKQFQRQRAESSSHFDIDSAENRFQVVDEINVNILNTAFDAFTGDAEEAQLQSNAQVLESKIIPGLRIVANALPPAVQKALLSRLLHRDLSNPQHLTNVHKFYEVPSPAGSFFSLSPSTNSIFKPKDSTIHKPLSIQQFLNKRLRWITLGGQYDWTEKVYPTEQPPVFPDDIAQLLRAIFPAMKPEAAIINLYSPGDTLSMHRDVAEFCDAGLISVSIGCEAVFIVGVESQERPEGDCRVQAIHLRSGDAVFMDGASRFAWHGVPQVVPGTCPEWLKDWPSGEEMNKNGADPYESWKGWMANKRINLNVRQMWENEVT